MKTLRILTILLITIAIHNACFGQNIEQPDTSRVLIYNKIWAKPGTFYLDSMEIDLKKVYLDPDNIKEMRSVRGPDQKLHSGTKGVTLITRKVNQQLSALGNISQQVDGAGKPFRYIIDGKLVNDTTGVLLEPSVIRNIEILKASDKPDHGFSQTTDILITTRLARKDIK